MKFTGAGQGRKTLVAEVVCGQLARRLGLRVPDLVRIQLDPVIGLGEPDQEVQELLKASGGLNLGMDFLPGSLGFDPLAYRGERRKRPGGSSGSTRWSTTSTGPGATPTCWCGTAKLWLIDHGATMIWHHNWPAAQAAAAKPYDASDHALAPFGPDVAAAAAELAPLVTEELLAEVAADVPDEWLADEPGFDSAGRAARRLRGGPRCRAPVRSTSASHSVSPQGAGLQAPGWLTEWPHGKRRVKR